MANMTAKITILLGYILLLCNLIASPALSMDTRNMTMRKQGDVKDGCQALLENFAASVGLFTFCAISHARPIRVCEKCIDTYLDVLKAHAEILELEDHSGQACKLELINLDRLEVIESTFQNVRDLWIKGHCDTCFVFEHGELTSQLSNNTQKFQLLFDNNEVCFQKYINETEKNITSYVCEDCKDIYCKMNEFYNQIKENVGDSGICIDVVDSMNSTRTKWSQQFGCTLNSMRLDLPFIIAALVVSFMPIVFYTGAKLFSIKAETRLLQQSRLSRHLSFPSTSRLAT